MFGLLVGALGLLTRVSTALGQLLPTISAFLVASPLAAFLPGVAITLAVIELTTRDVVSGAARLIAGFMRLAQLAFGIVIAIQVVGLTADDISITQVNKFGA